MTWIASGGTITASGGYTPPDTAGDYRIIAAVLGQNLNDTVLVTVLPDTATPPPPVVPDTTESTPPDTSSAPLPPPPPPDTTGTVPEPPDTLNSNEPPGMTMLTERGFDAKVEHGWWDRGNAAFSIVTDSSAPRSPANVGQALYGPRIPCGTGPISTAYRWPAPGPRTLYISLWLKVDPIWFGSTSLVNKLLFIHIAGGGRVIVNVNGSGMGRLAMEVRLQAMGVTTPRSISWNAGANINPAAARIPRGQWVHQEVLLVANTPGVADGAIHYWMNGVKVGQYTTDVGFSSATETGAQNVWEAVNWNPTYGGGCNGASANGQPLLDQFPVPQWMRIDHIYVSGK